MNTNDGLNNKVKKANIFFYDNIIDIYEAIDGRRSNELINWLDKKIKALSELTKGETLLDFGCGTGLVLKIAKKYFKKVYGSDVSSKMVEYASKLCDGAFLNDGGKLPFESESFDVVVSFAVLHHIYNHTNLFKEIHRVLKKGGVFYADHDMDINFTKKFGLPLKIYRLLFRQEKKYFKTHPSLTKEIYDLAEIHSKGINSDEILKQLKEIGFTDIKEHYHWFGLNKITNIIFKNKTFNKGFAPLFAVTAKK